MITINNLTKSYQLTNEASEKMTILHNLNLTVQTGEVVAVLDLQVLVKVFCLV